MNKFKKNFCLLLTALFLITGCSEAYIEDTVRTGVEDYLTEEVSNYVLVSEDTYDEENSSTESAENASETVISLDEIPDYSGEPYVVINGNVPFFEESEITTEVFETYSELDSLGRCGVAYANICTELMPTEERESISEVHPTGWNQEYYDIIVGETIWNVWLNFNLYTFCEEIIEQCIYEVVYEI